MKTSKPRSRTLQSGATFLFLACIVGACSDAPTEPRMLPHGRSGTEFQLDPLDVTGCQYGGEYPDCKSAPIDDGGGGPTSPDGTQPGGDGGGGNTGDGDNTASTPEPCNTADPVVNSSAVQQGFADLWNQSDASATEDQRHERGGWIVQNGNEYSIVPWPQDAYVSHPCRMDLSTLDVPPNVVGWVHTHPYAIGDSQYECPRGIHGGIPTYTGNANPGDLAVARRFKPIGADRTYTIDKNGVNQFTSSTRQGTVDNRYPRCGY